MQLAAGSYAVEWHGVNSRETKQGSKLNVERDGSVRFTSPFVAPGPSLLYLKQAGR